VNTINPAKVSPAIIATDGRVVLLSVVGGTEIPSNGVAMVNIGINDQRYTLPMIVSPTQEEPIILGQHFIVNCVEAIYPTKCEYVLKDQPEIVIQARNTRVASRGLRINTCTNWVTEEATIIRGLHEARIPVTPSLSSHTSAGAIKDDTSVTATPLGKRKSGVEKLQVEDQALETNADMQHTILVYNTSADMLLIPEGSLIAISRGTSAESSS